jgi:hypothetical protein
MASIEQYANVKIQSNFLINWLEYFSHSNSPACIVLFHVKLYFNNLVIFFLSANKFYSILYANISYSFLLL